MGKPFRANAGTLFRTQRFATAGGGIPRAVIDSLLERSGLIISRGVSPGGARLLAFSHLSFQEYLVSCWLQTEMHPAAARALILEKHADSWWKESILLYVAQMEFPLAITRELYERAHGEGALDGLIFAGYCLAEVQADKSDPAFQGVLNDLVFLASASRISAVNSGLLVAQFYEREDRFHGYSLPNVAAYSLMHLLAMPNTPLPPRGRDPRFDPDLPVTEA